MTPRSYFQHDHPPEWAKPNTRVAVRQAGRPGGPTAFGRIAQVRLHMSAHVADIDFDDGTTAAYDFFWIRPLNLIEAIGELGAEGA